MTKPYDQVWKSIAEDEEYRREFNLDVDTTLAFQIRLLREKNGWTQEQLAERVGSRQETISQWEDPNYGRYTLKTLKGLATGFDVGLMVKFAPFSEVVEWNANLTPNRLAPPNFAEEQSIQALEMLTTSSDTRTAASTGDPAMVSAATLTEISILGYTEIRTKALTGTLTEPFTVPTDGTPREERTDALAA